MTDQRELYGLMMERAYLKGGIDSIEAMTAGLLDSKVNFQERLDGVLKKIEVLKKKVEENE